jgi:hypothetical protein
MESANTSDAVAADTAVEENTTAKSSESRVTGGGIKDFIAHTSLIGNVIAAAAHQKSSFEPLPFPDYHLFEENYGK